MKRIDFSYKDAGEGDFDWLEFVGNAERKVRAPWVRDSNAVMIT